MPHRVCVVVLGVLSLGCSGCKPKPVVVIDRGPEVVREGVDVQNDVDLKPILPPPAERPPAARTGVDVQVGGGRGVDVKVGTGDSAVDRGRD